MVLFQSRFTVRRTNLFLVAETSPQVASPDSGCLGNFLDISQFRAHFRMGSHKHSSTKGASPIKTTFYKDRRPRRRGMLPGGVAAALECWRIH